jgi:hypothetical protein
MVWAIMTFQRPELISAAEIPFQAAITVRTYGDIPHICLHRTHDDWCYVAGPKP